MSKTDLEHPPAQPTPEPEAKTPWESIDPPESAQAETSAGAATQTSKPPADFKPVHAEIPQGAADKNSPFASTAISAAGAEMADLASEIQSLVDAHSFNEEQEIVTVPAESPEERVASQAFLSDEASQSSAASLPFSRGGHAVSERQDTARPPRLNDEGADPAETPEIAPQFTASSVEPPVEPATIEETPWATMDHDGEDATVSPIVTAFVDIPRESPLLERLANLDLSDADLDALDSSDISDLSRGDLAMNRRIESGAAVTFVMTDPVAASIPQMGIVSEPATVEEPFDKLGAEEQAGDATVLVPEWTVVDAEHDVTVPQLALQPKTETETQWVLEAEIPPCPVTTGGAWTIPLMCLGIGLIACCMAIPQIDFNRRLRYEQRSLAANLESVQKQVAVSDEFLKKVMDDPTLAERLAGRQMKTIRKGQKVIPLEQVSDEGDMSPFALVAVAPPVDPPPYKPIRGTIANLCYDARSRLYLLGTAMTMVAVGLVMGFGAKQAS